MNEAAPVRRILHCDMDCFYAAVHTRDAPALRGRPVVVGGDPERRGVVASASYEARRYGIRSATPAARARRLCPDVVFISPDFPRYRREAERIFAIYREITPVVETVALDEAYLDVTEQVGQYGSGTAIGRLIKERVREDTGLVVSVGVAPNKLVAKIASDHGKPDGLIVVPPGRVEEFLAPLPVRALHGVGPSTERALAKVGVRTVADLRRRPMDELIGRFSFHGRTLYHYARGVDQRPVTPHQERKSLGGERTFASDLERLEEMDQVVERLAGEVAAGLARRDLAACTITVKVRFADFTTVTRSRTLRLPTADTDAMTDVARLLLRRTAAGRRAVRLLGVTGSTLVRGGMRQLDLFADSDVASTAGQTRGAVATYTDREARGDPEDA